MLIRPLLALTAVATGVVAYYLGQFPDIDERWPFLAASTAMGTVLVLLLLVVGGESRRVRRGRHRASFRAKLPT
jgi:hypothetical protein